MAFIFTLPQHAHEDGATFLSKLEVACEKLGACMHVVAAGMHSVLYTTTTGGVARAKTCALNIMQGSHVVGWLFAYIHERSCMHGCMLHCAPIKHWLSMFHLPSWPQTAVADPDVPATQTPVHCAPDAYPDGQVQLSTYEAASWLLEQDSPVAGMPSAEPVAAVSTAVAFDNSTRDASEYVMNKKNSRRGACNKCIVSVYWPPTTDRVLFYTSKALNHSDL